MDAGCAGKLVLVLDGYRIRFNVRAPYVWMYVCEKWSFNHEINAKDANKREKFVPLPTNVSDDQDGKHSRFSGELFVALVYKLLQHSIEGVCLCFHFKPLGTSTYWYNLFPVPILQSLKDTSSFFPILFLSRVRPSSMCTSTTFYSRRSSGHAVVTNIVRCSAFLPPGTCLRLLSGVGFSIVTARRYSSITANSRSRTFRQSFFLEAQVLISSPRTRVSTPQNWHLFRMPADHLPSHQGPRSVVIKSLHTIPYSWLIPYVGKQTPEWAIQLLYHAFEQDTTDTTFTLLWKSDKSKEKKEQRPHRATPGVKSGHYEEKMRRGRCMV